jgi:hypothetical protein
MIRRNFDILAVLVLALVLGGAGEFRDRVDRARLTGPEWDLVVRPALVNPDQDAFARIERRLTQKFESFDRRLTERAVRLHQRLERLPLCPLER